jgi:hypothetical protein
VPELVQVAYAPDLVEAEMLRGLLESEGIPSILQPLGIDGPGMGFGSLNPGGGAKGVMVHANRADAARALLAEVPAENEEEQWPESANARYLEEAEGSKPRNYGLAGGYARIYFWSFGAMALAFGIFLLLRAA